MLDRRETSADVAPGPNAWPGSADRLCIVGIGASAGGLDAATRLIDAIPSGTRMAFILVQHLDPGHDSMLVELLAGHTAMTIYQATEGMPIEPEHLYVIPPGAYLSVGQGALHLSDPPHRHGARMPFDFLLQSLAEAYGPQAGCVILSGTGSDGSAGLQAIKAGGGLVLAQDPAEAEYDGMPRSAIQTGAVASVLPIVRIPAALAEFRPVAHPPAAAPKAQRQAGPPGDAATDVWLPKIVDLLRTETAHDFTHYKSGTLLRRVQRRMALATIKPNDIERYLHKLEADAEERNLLAKDLLISVTSFFRDTTVFDHLAATVIPELIRNHGPDRPLRIWVAGCSTGEETYSLAMLFLEQIGASKRPIKLQVFASDIDANSVATARDGVYPDAIESSISGKRLHRFFAREEGGYRALPDLRAAIVFTVQDVLTDPPFARLDLVSCRNLLIYLQPEAQSKVISMFHFALRNNGILLLGSAETVADAAGRFEVVSKADRIYRRLGRASSTKLDDAARANPAQSGNGARPRPMPTPARVPPRTVALAELGRRLVIETYAPAAILINAANETQFSLGPTDRYLRHPPGHATHDLLAMARPGLGTKLRTAIEQARQTRAKVVVAGRITGEGHEAPFNLEVFPVLEAGEEMLLVCFVEAPQIPLQAGSTQPRGQIQPSADLEHDLEATKTELQVALRDLELSIEEQKATSEEALSVNEEYQSTNEELLTSKEELQSVNEELTALNNQLQETLERQRTTSDDLQNILYSTNVATLFLDRDLRIRFFTPATKSLFAVIAGDVGRPLADLAALTPDRLLDADARAVLDRLEPVEREVQTKDGVWFRRRILPYRVHGDRVEGVVITFTDITARKSAATALEAATKQAEVANAAKSRFLAAASHDLRQPMQTLALLQALLGKVVEGEKAARLMTRLDDTLSTMTGMLDTLLDINEIEAGGVHAQVSVFPVNDLLHRLRDEFTYHAQDKGLALHVVSSSHHVLSDPRLLEQMVRNVLSNALKYTTTGRVLVGCRPRGKFISIEVLDTGIGIPEAEIDKIFEEYHQVDNEARERSRGLGLGLSIVKRLGELLGHAITVRSLHGRGSCFAVEVPLAAETVVLPGEPVPATAPEEAVAHRAKILVVEDDPDLRDLLEEALQGYRYHVATAADGPAALASLAHGTPNLLLADYNLPNGLSGIDLVESIRQALGRDLPAIILTGDISAETKHDVERRGYAHLSKPVKLANLMGTIDRLLARAASTSPPATEAPSRKQTVFVVDDDDGVRGALVAILQATGRTALGFGTGEAFLQAYRPGSDACLLVDAYLPGVSGIELLERLHSEGYRLPAIMITGQSDVAMAVRAMKAGASDFIEKPVGQAGLLQAVSRALEQAQDSTKQMAWQEDAARQVAGLTSRQREIMTLVLAGHPSKNIAADLGISRRTVENHRASIMRKTGVASLPALARLALAGERAGRPA